MAKTRTQEHRMLGLETPLGDNKLLILAMHGSEALGRLFQYELDLFSEGSAVDYTKILGQNVTIWLTMQKDEKRYFNGFVSKFSLVAVDESQDAGTKTFTYRATVVPWTWFLTRVSDCRIFQDKTVPDIVKEVLSAKGSDFKFELTGSFRKWEYCVQYRETDFNFISRLMENEGIYYYFKHEDGKHTMMICNAPTAHSAASNYSDLHFDKPDLNAGHDAFIWNWDLGREITSNQYALTDYDPLQPKTSLLRVLNVEHTHDPGTYELFDYPGGYVTSDEGGAYAHIRIEEVEAAYAVAHGTSSARGIYTGATFTLQDHPACDAEEYLITGINYEIRNDEVGSGLGQSSAGGDQLFLSEVTCIPHSYEYRTPRLTPKPIVQGPQTARVVGPSGEEIYTDKYGRIKVKFFWDRTEAANETSSCWIRVSQNWAGKKWGIIFNPRIGQEVIVEFLEGDPDRPIITGRVYNGDQMPPYDLPANQTQSTIKSRSSKEGTQENFNEIRFEDKKGSEQILIHAEKNQDIEVEKDETHWVGNNRTKKIDNDETTHVKHDREETVDNNETITIHGTRTETVDKDETVTIHATRTETVDKDVSHTWGAKLTQSIQGAVSITMADAQTVSVAKDQSVSIDGGRSQSIGKDDTISVGKKLVIDAADEINITCGDASIVMKSDGTITISGKDITIKGSGKINAKADGDMILKGSKIGAN